MSVFGLIYRSVPLYRMTMKVLYGADYKKKYRVVEDEIPAGSKVVDLCCGDCRIAPGILSKNCTYLGLDASPWFISWAKSKGIDGRLWNGKADPIPSADVVCLQSSLYQFIPEAGALIRRMLESARIKVIITEPVQNLTNGTSGLLRKLSKWLSRANGETFHHRHSKETLQRLLVGLPPESVETRSLGREMMIVLSKPLNGAA